MNTFVTKQKWPLSLPQIANYTFLEKNIDVFVYAGVAELILNVIIVELFIYEMCPMVARFLKYRKLKMACQEELKE